MGADACAGATTWAGAGAGVEPGAVADAEVEAVADAEAGAGAGAAEETGFGRRCGFAAAAAWRGLGGRVATRAVPGLRLGLARGPAGGTTRSATRAGTECSSNSGPWRCATAAEPKPIPAVPAKSASMRPIEGVVRLAAMPPLIGTKRKTRV